LLLREEGEDIGWRKDPGSKRC